MEESAALGPKGLARLHGRIMKLTASENQVAEARKQTPQAECQRFGYETIRF